jgi:hypothetical protein
MTRKVEIERFSLITSKPFDQVVAALNAGIGHPDTRGDQAARPQLELVGPT